jgi:2-C-methyl-D-erythritol 4-phosphate cytidylyltransferase
MPTPFVKNNFVGTDESVLLKRAGFKVNIVDGSIINFKIKYPEHFQSGARSKYETNQTASNLG